MLITSVIVGLLTGILLCLKNNRDTNDHLYAIKKDTINNAFLTGIQEDEVDFDENLGNIECVPDEETAFEVAQIMFGHFYPGFKINHNRPIDIHLVNNKYWRVEARTGFDGLYDMECVISKANAQVYGIRRDK